MVKFQFDPFWWIRFNYHLQLLHLRIHQFAWLQTCSPRLHSRLFQHPQTNHFSNPVFRFRLPCFPEFVIHLSNRQNLFYFQMKILNSPVGLFGKEFLEFVSALLARGLARGAFACADFLAARRACVPPWDTVLIHASLGATDSKLWPSTLNPNPQILKPTI